MNDYIIMRRAVSSVHWRTMLWRGGVIDLRGAPYSDALPQPITINLRKEVLAELRLAEESSWQQSHYLYTGRSPHSHVYAISRRSKSRLAIYTHAEAEDAYYAVCAGTFSLRSRACYNAARRIAIALEPYASPATVATWPISGIRQKL